MMDALDDEEYTGSLVSLLQAGLDFVRRNTRKAWRKTADNRLEYPEYPERAVEESLVNALIHRNYLELGSEVHIDMYDDRLEIFSPGGLMDGGSIKDMDVMNMASRRRNPILADIFSRLKYMERRGSGFKKIVTAYKSHDGYTEGMDPTFSTPWDSFVLTLPKFDINKLAEVYSDIQVASCNDVELGERLGETTQKESDTTQKTTQKHENTTQSADGLGEKLGENQKRILQLLSSNSLLTIKDLAETLGISTTAVENNLARLKQKNLLVRVGGDKGGHWEVLL